MDTVLIVDDIDINRLILREILSGEYNILEAANGYEALEIMFNGPVTPTVVLLDIMMPGMDGFEVLASMKTNVKTERIPVLFITAADANTNESRGLQEGASDYISKPFNPDVVKVRIRNTLQLKMYQDGLEMMLEQKTAELVATHERTLETLATIVEYRDLESGAHIRRTSELSRILVHAMLKTEKFYKQLIYKNYNSLIKAVALHDIGKIGIPDNVLLKPGALTKEEFEIIKQHCEIGHRIIMTIAEGAADEAMYLAFCKEICLSHHERWDGKGYPNGLADEQIPLSARILSVVDVYDALVNRRCYKPPLSHEDAMQLLQNGAGTQFDPDIVAVLMTVSDDFRKLEDELGDK